MSRKYIMNEILQMPRERVARKSRWKVIQDKQVKLSLSLTATGLLLNQKPGRFFKHKQVRKKRE